MQHALAQLPAVPAEAVLHAPETERAVEGGERPDAACAVFSEPKYSLSASCVTLALRLRLAPCSLRNAASARS